MAKGATTAGPALSGNRPRVFGNLPTLPLVLREAWAHQCSQIANQQGPQGGKDRLVRVLLGQIPRTGEAPKELVRIRIEGNKPDERERDRGRRPSCIQIQEDFPAESQIGIGHTTPRAVHPGPQALYLLSLGP